MIDVTRAQALLESALSKAAVAAAATSAGQCGPSPEEVGAAALASAGPAVAATCAALWLLLRLWRRLAAVDPGAARPLRARSATATPRRAWGALGIAAGLACAAGAARCLALSGDLQLAATATWVIGSLYLGLSLLIWRALAALGRRRAAVEAPWIAAIAVFGPAIPMTLSLLSDGAADLWLQIWLGASLQGAAGPLALGALLAEVGARRWAARRRARAPERRATAAPAP